MVVQFLYDLFENYFGKSNHLEIYTISHVFNSHWITAQFINDYHVRASH